MPCCCHSTSSISGKSKLPRLMIDHPRREFLLFFALSLMHLSDVVFYFYKTLPDYLLHLPLLPEPSLFLFPNRSKEEFTLWIFYTLPFKYYNRWFYLMACGTLSWHYHYYFITMAKLNVKTLSYLTQATKMIKMEFISTWDNVPGY